MKQPDNPTNATQNKPQAINPPYSDIIDKSYDKAKQIEKLCAAHMLATWQIARESTNEFPDQFNIGALKEHKNQIEARILSIIRS